MPRELPVTRTTLPGKRYSTMSNPGLEVLGVKVIKRQAEADRHDDPAHNVAIHSPSGVSAHITAQDGKSHHSHGIVPYHLILDDEDHHGDPVDAEGQESLERVNAMNVANAHQAQAGNHQNADSGAEIAPVDGDKKLKDDETDFANPGRMMRGAHANPAGNSRLEKEQSGCR